MVERKSCNGNRVQLVSNDRADMNSKTTVVTLAMFYKVKEAGLRGT